MDDESQVLERLHNLLRRRARTYRSVELELGLQHGYLSDLFRRRKKLRFGHVVEILRALGVTPQEFFSELYGLASPGPKRPRDGEEDRLQRAVEELVECFRDRLQEEVRRRLEQA